MKKIVVLLSIAVVFAITLACQFKDKKSNSKTENLEINREAFKEYIKNKPYTILYFWASWCGFSRAGLVNDYSKNYQSLKNDTVQSLLIVASDTNSINSFMVNNSIILPYKCLHEGKYPILIRNIMDGKNMEKFIKEMFNYKIESRGFPTVLLVDSSSNGLDNSGKTEVAVRIYRYFERNKIDTNNNDKHKKSP